MSSMLPRIFSTGKAPALSVARNLTSPWQMTAAACTLVRLTPHSGSTPNQLMCTAIVVRVRR